MIFGVGIYIIVQFMCNTGFKNIQVMQDIVKD